MLEFLIGFLAGNSMSGNKRRNDTAFKDYLIFICLLGLCWLALSFLEKIRAFALSSKDNANIYTIILIFTMIILSIYNLKGVKTVIPMTLNLIKSAILSYLFLVNTLFLYSIWETFYAENNLFLIVVCTSGIMTFMAFMVMAHQFIRSVRQY